MLLGSLAATQRCSANTRSEIATEKRTLIFVSLGPRLLVEQIRGCCIHTLYNKLYLVHHLSGMSVCVSLTMRLQQVERDDQSTLDTHEQSHH